MGPSELYEDKIPVGSFALPDWIFASKNFADGGYKGTIQNFLALVSNVLGQPVRRYADETALLANEDLAIGYLAIVTSSSDGWALYLYNGPAQDDLANYTLLASFGGTVIVDPTTSIVLNFDGRKNRKFVTTTNIAAPKTITVTNDADKGHLDYTIPISDVAAVLTMPSTFKMNDVRKVGNDWTPDNIGRYKLIGDWDGTNWNLDMYGPYP